MPQIKMYPAKEGDAFLIKHNKVEPIAILIDGGYSSTFKEYIFPDLSNLAQLGYSLTLAVATHIDSDHLSGLLAFFKQNGNSLSPKIIQVENVWHNSLRSISIKSEMNEGKISNDNNLLKEICRRGYPVPAGFTVKPDEISIRQGSSLAALLLGGNYCWNLGDGSESINVSENNIYKIFPDINIRVIGPPKNRLEQLYKMWVAELRRMGFAGKISSNSSFDDAFEFLCAFEDLRVRMINEPIALSNSATRQLDDVYNADDSITNGSSISLIIELGKWRLLFLGDSYSEDIEAELRKRQTATFPMVFDVIKISHHGSLRNTSPELLRIIDAPVYLISSSGSRHNLPNIEVLRAIVDRPSNFQRHLYFNYNTQASQKMHHYVSQSGALFKIYEGITDWIKISEWPK